MWNIARKRMSRDRIFRESRKREVEGEVEISSRRFCQKFFCRPVVFCPVSEVERIGNILVLFGDFCFECDFGREVPFSGWDCEFVQWQPVSLQKSEASVALERETVNDHRRTEFFKATRIILQID